MSALNFDDLMRHVGHKIVCVPYGKHGKPPWVNVAVECEDCCEVLLDFDREVKKMKYVVRLHHFYNPDPDEYTFTTKSKKEAFMKKLPKFYKENPNFISEDVRSE